MVSEVSKKDRDEPISSAALEQKDAGPNWLLRGLILLSVAVHVLVFLHIAGIYRSDAVTAIELTLKANNPQAVRDIPRPRLRPKAPPKPQGIEKLMAQRRSMPDMTPVKMDPVDPEAPDSLLEALSVPETPEVARPPVAAWTGGSPVDAGSFGTARDYFQTVRTMIENRKEYPYPARKRQAQGRVVVRFVISIDGTVTDISLVQSSSHRLLDTAALAAVKNSSPFPRPPQRLFSGPIPLEICVVFELM